MSKAKTLAKAGIENMIVCKMAYRLSALPASLKILVTLSTLITLAILGPTFRNPPAFEKSVNSNTTSPKEALTTKKSN